MLLFDKKLEIKCRAIFYKNEMGTIYPNNWASMIILGTELSSMILFDSISFLFIKSVKSQQKKYQGDSIKYWKIYHL